MANEMDINIDYENDIQWKNWNQTHESHIQQPKGDGVADFYTDGSKKGKESQSGAGWALVNKEDGTITDERSVYIEESTVFQAEIQAIKEVCEYIKDNTMEDHRINIWSDSQAAILALEGRKVLPESIIECKKAMEGLKLNLNWVRGHNNDTGNEVADMLAKKVHLSLQLTVM